MCRDIYEKCIKFVLNDSIITVNLVTNKCCSSSLFSVTRNIINIKFKLNFLLRNQYICILSIFVL